MLSGLDFLLFNHSQRRLKKLLLSDRFFKKDFAVVLQPYLENAGPPRLPVRLTHNLTFTLFISLPPVSHFLSRRDTNVLSLTVTSERDAGRELLHSRLFPLHCKRTRRAGKGPVEQHGEALCFKVQ